jgi:hypothetical protein
VGGRDWTFSFEARTRGLGPRQTGLGWRLAPIERGAPLEPLEVAPALENDDWQKHAVRWRLAPGARLYRLALWISRPTGQVRAEGELTLRGLALSGQETTR